MRYLTSEPLTVHVFVEQKDKLKNIQSELFEKYEVKLPISELVRLALEYGIPKIDEDRSFVNQHLNFKKGSDIIVRRTK